MTQLNDVIFYLEVTGYFNFFTAHTRAYLHERANILTYSDVCQQAHMYVHTTQYKSMHGYGHTRMSMSTSKNSSHRIKIK